MFVNTKEIWCKMEEVKGLQFSWEVKGIIEQVFVAKILKCSFIYWFKAT